MFNPGDIVRHRNDFFYPTKFPLIGIVEHLGDDGNFARVRLTAYTRHDDISGYTTIVHDTFIYVNEIHMSKNWEKI